MKSWWPTVAAAVLLIILCGLPFQEHETARLLPMKTVQVELTADGVHLVSEIGEGSGANWNAAVQNLRANAPGEVFFDTAEQLILCDRAVTIVPEILEDGTLRPAAQVYRADALQEPEGLNDYLAAHESALTLGALRAYIAEDASYQIPQT